MITLCKTKNYGINCRCGVRSVWKVPEPVALAVTTNSPCELTVKSIKKSENQGSGRTLLNVGSLHFECECGRFFELTKDGLKNVSDGDLCSNWMQKPLASTMLN